MLAKKDGEDKKGKNLFSGLMSREDYGKTNIPKETKTHNMIQIRRKIARRDVVEGNIKLLEGCWFGLCR